MDTEESREQLWHRLDNESGRAYEAFKVYMYLPPAERSVGRAWREWSANPDAKREPPYFYKWSRDYAWSDGVRAHDHHIEVLREEGQEEAIREEAARPAKPSLSVADSTNFWPALSTRPSSIWRVGTS